MEKYYLRKHEKLMFCDKCHESFQEKIDFDLHNCSHNSEHKVESIVTTCIPNEKMDSKMYRNEIKKSSKTYGKGIKLLEKDKHCKLADNCKLADHICDLCQETFSKKLHLNNHKMTVHGVKPFPCDFCYKRFKRRSNLALHMRVHSLKPFKCDICAKEFMKQRNLAIHYRLHTGESPFKCEVCQKSFNTKSLLGTHMRVHTAKSNFLCEYCSRTFQYKSHMICHMRMTHFQEKSFACEVCSSEFKDIASLETHACHCLGTETH